MPLSEVAASRRRGLRSRRRLRTSGHFRKSYLFNLDPGMSDWESRVSALRMLAIEIIDLLVSLPACAEKLFICHRIGEAGMQIELRSRGSNPPLP
jgi:hypothetical protein